MKNLQELKSRATELSHLGDVSSMVGWDQQTYMPHGAAEMRANQLATLSTISHRLMTDPRMGELIDNAQGEVANLDPDSDETRLVQVLKRDYDQATKLPTEFVAEFTKTRSLAHEIWAKARQDNDFEAFRPIFEKIVELCRQQTEYLGYEEHAYDALLDQYEAGMKTSHVEAIFAGLREELVPFAAEIFARKDRADDSILHRYYPIEQQRAFGMKVAAQLGFDFNRGRQDESVHPFCTSFSSDDVRITTRFDDHFLSPALFGTIHETGHGMYEQGIGRNLVGTYLGTGTSLGVHESQSRLWENMVGRSYEFWQFFYDDLRATFPDTLKDISLDDFYRAINTVQPSLIRVEADEVTYPLHIMLRFELEQDLLNGKLAVKDVPAAWNAKFESYLGITPPDDALGCLQDVHWSSGILGYFPTYSLGTLLAAQLYEKVLADHPNLKDEIRNGKFDTLLTWMQTNIHAHGRKLSPQEITMRATGSELSYKPFMSYLREKFGAVYGI